MPKAKKELVTRQEFLRRVSESLKLIEEEIAVLRRAVAFASKSGENAMIKIPRVPGRSAGPMCEIVRTFAGGDGPHDIRGGTGSNPKNT